MSIEFDSESVYEDIDKYIKTKIKLYENKINTNFQGKEVHKENASYDCLSVMALDSVINVNKTYYPKTLLEECKFEIKMNKRHDLISDDLELDTDSESYDEFECNSIDSD